MIERRASKTDPFNPNGARAHKDHETFPGRRL